ncbi:DNA-directed RNA polymerase sigma-70 factor [Paenibacillus albidus]|uniref:DNA-directed RNA polymerase sigma-70 factor n=1 Tax=Paenibacillus albidus TaxID=2041023 RepID=A0A917CZ12_9BACL|nr:RNA polymerase sigma factor [Paenibacillus albidus]GGG04251.1 DNA-directed RNA polymerase sigma-70 factor [Paenibacillus albidus]
MKPGQLHQLLQPKMLEIRKYLIRLGAPAADAEDIVQDAVYKALLYMESIDERKFSAWLYKVAINRYYDLCRRRKRIVIPLDEVEVADMDLPEDHLLQQEKKEDIERVLGELLPLHKQLLIMKYELELSYQEIAELLGIKTDTVKSALFRARKQFQNKYRGDEE